ncbi:MAG: tetratricopeptide repeat protein [Bacteroidetes bacterium]|nr:tetratricopeptide repeat protein [Bacteroidota bacterium]
MTLKSILLTTGILATGYLMMGIDGCGGSKEMTSAKLYIQQKQLDKALSSVNAEIAKNPTNAEAYYYKGIILYDMKETVKMAAAFREGLKVGFKPEQKKDAEARIQNGWANEINNGTKLVQTAEENPENYLKAIEKFKIAAEIQPDSALTYQYIAIAQFNAKLYNEVPASVQTYIGKKHEDEAILNLAVQAYKNLSDYNSAIAFLEKYKSSKYVTQNYLYETIAQTYIDAGRADDALKAFMDASDANPSNEVMKYNVGVLLLNKDSYEESVKYFEGALAIRPDYKEASYNLGVAYLRLGKKRQDAIEEAYSKEKDRKKKEKIAQDKSHLDYFKKALPYLEAVKDSRTDDVVFWTVLGQVYTALGMNDKAKEAFDRFK